MNQFMQDMMRNWPDWHLMMLVSIMARVIATIIGILTGVKTGPISRLGYVRIAVPLVIIAFALPWSAHYAHSMGYVYLLQIVLPILHYVIIHYSTRRLIAIKAPPLLALLSLLPYATLILVIVLCVLEPKGKV